MPAELVYQPIRAPRRHGQILVDPAWDAVDALLADNRAQAECAAYDVQGLSLRQLRAEARGHLLQEARRYTRAYRDVALPAGDGGPLLLAGHQPQLFHPGVWFKNFALSGLARRLGGQAVNLLIDNDILRQPAIRVPTRVGDETQVISLPLDRVVETIPFEQRDVVDAELFGSFADRVLDASRDVLAAPLVQDYWQRVLAARQRSANLGRCLAEARHRLEGDWGQHTWEVPLSAVCQSAAFARFACHLLAELPRFQQVHNTALHEYRRVNRVRSRAHPVPDLEQDGVWHEAPFWLWSDAAPSRKRAFVRRAGQGLELTDRAGLSVSLPLAADGDARGAVDVLVALGQRGVKLRPRALVTTMYARLVLSDLFLHGIGGAKYDQLTDLLVRRFCGWRPPGFLTLSATVLLFEDRTVDLAARIRAAKQQLREFRFQPERHLTADRGGHDWIAEKRAWLGCAAPRGQRRERHEQIARLNARLSELLQGERRQTADDLAQWTAELRRQTSLASREFAFCLFSEKNLRPLLLELSAGSV